MKLKDNGGKDFEPAPEGSHIGRCFQVVDLGTQHFQVKGKEKSQRKIRLAWELPEVTIDIEGEEQPTIVSREFGATLSEKSHLRAFLVNWRGRQFTKEELEGFDPRVLIGQPCLVSVVHETKGDKTYANVVSASAIPKAMRGSVPQSVLEPVYFSLDEFERSVFQRLPEWMQKKIEQSDEFKALQNHDPANENQERQTITDDDIGEIPF